MLFDLINSGFDKQLLIQLLLSIPVILFALTIHEFSHGFIAYKLGDPTAKAFGRLTLNPIKHLDPIGALLMLIGGFGWAKPVPINTRYFKNAKWGMALSALAGPVSNFVLSFVSYIIYYLLASKLPWHTFSDGVYNLLFAVVMLFAISATMNLSLAIFNFIPIPPLDGSRVLFAFLPGRIYFAVMRYEQIIMGLLMAAIVFGGFSSGISIVTGFVLQGFDKIATLVFG